jgi:putative FmdB family regulatory protein
MPSYNYACTACNHRFELQHSITQYNADTLIFCPQCWSVAKRDAADWATVRVLKTSASAEEQHPQEQGHVHSAACGCALKDKHWEQELKTLVQEEQTLK